MSNSSILGALTFADESAFGEVSTTFDERLPIITPVDVSGLTQEMQTVDPVKQYQNDGNLMMRGVQGGSFSVDLYLCGHGSATTGAVSATAEENFLSRVVGNINVANDGGAVNATTNANQFTTKNMAAPANGSLIRVGSLGDSRGDGQYAAVKVGSTMTLHTAIGGSPDEDDVIYTPCMIFPSETATSSSITSQRFNIQTANQKYSCHGCFPSAISISGLNPGEIPKVTVTMSVARWTSENVSAFPSAVSVDSFTPSPVAGGSFWFNTFGADARQTYSIREFNLNIEMTVTELKGPGATDAYQTVVGARRTKCQATFDFVVDSETAGTTTWETLWNTSESSATFQHCLYTCSAGRDGATLGFYFPKVQMVGQRPVQFDMDGVNRQRVSCRAVTSSAASTDLEKANFIMGLG